MQFVFSAYSNAAVLYFSYSPKDGTLNSLFYLLELNKKIIWKS